MGVITRLNSRFCIRSPTPLSALDSCEDFNTPPGRKEAHMDNKPVSVTEKVIGDTLYIIESVVSDTAKETAYDKLKRMILGEVESQKIKLAS
jgi:hypothetical protein